jgi:hypothetical protein
LLHWKLAPSDDLARELHTVIDSNRENSAPSSCGGRLARCWPALFTFEWTREARWQELYLRDCDAL